SDGGEYVSVVVPHVLVVLLDDSRAALFELLGKAVLPDPGMLDEVIVDRDDLVVVLQWHFSCLLRRGSPTARPNADMVNLLASFDRGSSEPDHVAGCAPSAGILSEFRRPSGGCAPESYSSVALLWLLVI